MIMPVLNGGRYFAAALASVIAQDYDNLEIIVVDDGSTDRHTAEVARTFASVHAGKIKYLYQDNQGVAAALNAGIAAATGDFFAWLSHDDLYSAQFVSSQIRFYQALGISDACVYSNYSLIDSDSNILAKNVLDVELYQRDPELGLLHSGINGCTILIPMELLRRYLPFDPRLRYTQDYDLWGRLLQHHPFVLNDADLVHYRIHDAQGTRQPGAVEEGNRLWVRLLEGQDELRRAQMFGSSPNFYAQMAKFLWNTPYAEAARYAQNMASVSSFATRISILMWVCDDVHANKQTLDSILTQTHQCWDLWLLAPSWTLTTEALNNEIVDRSRITWIIADGGPAELGNRALDVARGDYFTFVRSGEWWAPDRLSRQVAAMQAAGATISYGAYLVCLEALSSRRIEYRPGKEAAAEPAGNLSPIEVALPTVMAHRMVVGNGLRFDPAAGDPFVLFVAWLGMLYDWLYLESPLAEMPLGFDSPLLQPSARLALESNLCEVITAADRIFAAPALLPDLNRAHRTSSALWAKLNEGVVSEAEKCLPLTDAGSSARLLKRRANSAQQRILIVTHDWGGGTDRFVQKQIQTFTKSGLDVLILAGVELDDKALLHRVNAFGGSQETFSLQLNLGEEDLAAELQSLGIVLVVVNALVSIPTLLWLALKRAVDLAGIPYDVHLHDYSHVCPRLHLTLPDGSYCGAPDLPSCERCIAVNGGLVPSAGVGRWRTQHGWLLSGARRILAPHLDVRHRYQRYFPGLPIEVEPHSDEAQRPVRVVVMGHCGIHKGANTFVEVARQAERQRYPLEFVMIGSCDRAEDLTGLYNVRLMGAYREGELERLLHEVQPDIAWFPGQAAETFSYTLSTAFAAGLFPVAFDIGAIAQRITAAGTGLVLPLSLAHDAEAVCQQLLRAVIDRDESAAQTSATELEQARSRPYGGGQGR
ncbi:MAG: glycosyltransferase [Brevundimonas sp.]|nr:glycosyltransferase [Brevundimonas sp.]